MARKTEVKTKWPKPEIKGDQLKAVLGYQAERQKQEGKPLGFPEIVRELIDKGLKA